jgi:hypothetical protein
LAAKKAIAAFSSKMLRIMCRMISKKKACNDPSKGCQKETAKKKNVHAWIKALKKARLAHLAARSAGEGTRPKK